jgi:hypothetical protein
MRQNVLNPYTFTILTDCYKLFTSYLRKNHSVENRKKILTCQKIASPFTDPYGCLQVMTSYLRIPASYVRMLVIDYELAIRMTRKKKQHVALRKLLSRIHN